MAMSHWSPSYMALAAALLLCSVQVAVAQYAGGASTGYGGTPVQQSPAGAPASNGAIWSKGLLSDSRLEFDDVLKLRDLKGVWQTVGDWYPQSVYTAITNNTMPNCSADAGMYSYNRLDITAPQFYILAGSGNDVIRINSALQRTTFTNTTSYNNSKIMTTNAAGVISCQHFSPYVDLQTGELMAESITMTLWTMNATSGAGVSRPIRTQLACEIVGNEMPGCYSSGEVARTEIGFVSARSITPIPRLAGTVVTVTKATYVCRNGECLKLSPKYADSSPVYGG